MSPLVRSELLTADGVTALWFAENDWVPNSASLPVLVYTQAIAMPSASVGSFERLFARNDWPPQWRDGVYDFHHFHSTAHEVLGVAAGSADLILGGPDGHLVTVSAGACVVLPAGTGHCRAAASVDFLVVGAYPSGQDWDLQRCAIPAAQLAAMRALPIPSSDPVRGEMGVLQSLWGRA